MKYQSLKTIATQKNREEHPLPANHKSLTVTYLQMRRENKMKISKNIKLTPKHANLSSGILRMSWMILLMLTVAFSAFAQEGFYSNNKADQTLRSNGRINPSTLGLEISVPLANYPGRAGSVPISLSYSSKVWRIQYAGEGKVYNTPNCYTNNRAKYAENSASGWTSSLGTAYIQYLGEDNLYDENGKTLSTGGICEEDANHQRNYVKRIIVHLPSGESHELRASDEPVVRDVGSSASVDMTGTYYSVDGSKMKYVEDGNGTYRLHLPDGAIYDFASTKTWIDEMTVRTGTLYKDANGNQLAFNAPNTTYPNGSWTDTLGRTIPVPISPTAAPSAPGTQNYQLPGITNPYKFVWKKLKDSTAAESALTDFNQSLKYPGSVYSVDTLGRLTTHPGTDVLFHSDTTALTFDFPNTLFNPVVLTEIELPNGSKYKFSYNIYGEIEKIIYPTGGEERLTLGAVNPVDPITAQIGSRIPYEEANRGVTERKVYENSSATPSVWTYATGTEGSNFKATTTAPDGSRTERILISSNPCTLCEAGDYGFGFILSGMPIEERTYSATNQLLAKKLTTWTKTEFTVNGANKNAEWHPRVTKEESVIYNPATGAALSSTSTTEYAGNLSALDNPLNVSKTNQYGYSATVGSLGSLEKSVETDYSTDSNYLARNMKSLPTETRVKDAAGNVKAKSQIAYDESTYPLISAGTDTMWTDPSTTYRGNPTTSRSWTDVAANQYIETHAQFDNFGNARKAWDAKGNLSEVEFSSAYKYAYPTKTISTVPDPTGTNGSSTAFETTSVYDMNTGLVTSTTDTNGQTSTMEYNDALLRPTKVIPPTGGAQTVMEYTDTPGAMAVKTKTQIDATNWAESTVYADGLGRSVKSEKKDDAGNVFAETEYDSMGRVKKVTNPYRTGDTKLWTENTYDDLSRVTKVKTPDNAEVTTAYDISTSGTLGTIVTATDQSGKPRRSLTNGLGQLVRVDEPNDAGSLGTIASPNQATAYSYDTLNNLVTVNQGVQTRTFQYDSLSRLKQATNPESGTISYAYDANGNLTGKTDARSITTTYAYDNLNRVKSRSYSDSTPAVAYNYDGTGLSSVPSYAKGKLTKVSSSVSETRYNSFDNLGKILSSRQVTDGQTYDFGYSYNLAGMLMEETYPSGRKVKNTIAADGDLGKVETMPTGGSYQARADNFSYTAAGAVSSMQLGNSKWENAQFNSRLQPTQLGLGTSATDQSLWKVNYEYGNATENNGNVTKQTITAPSITPLVQTYTYDSLNRLKSATENIQNSTETWKQTFQYDRYGNRNFDAANTTTLGSCSTAQCNPSIDAANNRFTTNQGYTYDLSGNLLTDAQSRSFVYDAENKQKTVSDASGTIGTYSYDGDGKRVKKVSQAETTVFAYDASGKLAAEYLLTTATPQTATTSYLTSDTLGSPRVITDSAGTVTSRRDFMPFGEEIVNLGNRTSAIGYQADSTRQKFTGYERDSESDLDFGQARYYSSRLGRFNSADNFLNDTKVADTQSWNLYVYVRNNPLKLIDPRGEKVYAGNITDPTDKAEYLKRANYTYGCSSCVTIDEDGYVQVDTTGLSQEIIDATTFLTDAINSTSQFFEVQVSNNDPKVLFGNSQDGAGNALVKNSDGTTQNVKAVLIKLDFADDAQVVAGSEADRASFLNLVFAHEVSHFAPKEKKDPTTPGLRGPVDNPINEIRLARGLPLRASYQARGLAGLAYVKFGEAVRDSYGNVVRGTDGIEVTNETGRLFMWLQNNPREGKTK